MMVRSTASIDGVKARRKKAVLGLINNTHGDDKTDQGSVNNFSEATKATNSGHTHYLHIHSTVSA